MTITKIESLLNKELAKVQGNEDVYSDISGCQESKILEDRISSKEKIRKGYIRHPDWNRNQWMRELW